MISATKPRKAFYLRAIHAFCWTLLLSLSFLLSSCHRHPVLQGYLEGEYIYLSSNYSGVLKQLAVSRGQNVKKGQLIYVLDSEPEASIAAQAKDQWEQAEKTLHDLQSGQRSTVLESIIAQRQQAVANLAYSKKTLQRYRQLYLQGVMAKASLDQAQSNYDRDLNSVNQFEANLQEAKKGARENQIMAQSAAAKAAKAAYDKAQWQLDQKTVRAPVAGLINDTYFKPGEFVNAQQPVASLLAPENVYLVFYIPEPLRSELRMGQNLEFSCDHCQQSFSAMINYISAQAEYTPPVIFSRESRGKLVFRVQAALPLATAKRFYPGQPVEVHLQ